MCFLLHIRTIFAISACAAIPCSATAVLAQDTQQIAIAKEMLTSVCGEFPETKGEGQTLTIRGDAEAKLTGLVKKLADIGVAGAGSFASDKYVGMIRSEVGGELKSVRDCRLKVWPDVKNLATGQKTGDQIINSVGDRTNNIIGNNNNASQN